MMKILLTASVVFITATSFAKEEKNSKIARKPAATECLSANKVLAENILKNAAQRIGFDSVSEVKLEWISATGERYVFSGSIYKSNYEIVVKTDGSCFPQEVELIDTARK